MVAHGFVKASGNCETVGNAAPLAGRKASLMMSHLAAIERALVDAGGSVAAAARMLGIPSAELRKLARTHPSLTAVVFEQIEQQMDAARRVLLDGLRSDKAMTRIRAAGYILRHTDAGRRRGFGSRDSWHDEPVEPQIVTLKWLDT
jgi:hypothetical protein